jgi:hypothetical protein
MNQPFLSAIRELTGTEPGEGMEDRLLLELLTKSIAELLAQPGEKLFQILYRLDVPEKKVNQVLESCAASEWPSELARLILHREKERQFWRTRYKQNPNSNLASENQIE